MLSQNLRQNSHLEDEKSKAVKGTEKQEEEGEKQISSVGSQGSAQFRKICGMGFKY